MSFIDNCRKFVGLDSTPSQGTRDIAQFAAELCREAGLKVEIEEENLNGLSQCNVIARLGDPHSSELMLQTHLDTLDPGNFALWTKTEANPFNASIYGNELYGLGAVDMKLDFLCKLEALKTFSRQKLKRPVVLVGTYGSQTGMAGAVKLLRRKRIAAKVALVGAPTGLRLAPSGQGLAVVEICVPFSEEEIDYREKHDMMESGSTQSRIFSVKPGDSEQNAIVKMLDYLTQLPEGIAVMDLDGGVNSNSIPTSAVLEIDVVGGFSDPIVPKLKHVLSVSMNMEKELVQFAERLGHLRPPTLNLGSIRTYGDQVRLIGSCRLPPSVTDEHYEKWMATMRVECEKVGAEFRIRDYKGAFEGAVDSPFVRMGQAVLNKMQLSSDLYEVPASTEANVFKRLGIECLAIGPGKSVANSPGANECVRIDELHLAVDFYRRFIEEYNR